MKIILLALIIHFYILIDGIFSENLRQLYLSPSTSNLSCYTCSTIDDIRCKVINETYYYYNNKYSTYNTRLYGSECASNEHFCAVLRLDAKIDQNSMDYKFWAIERKCVKDCVDGCFFLGERTKLSLCTTCCTSNYCNVGNATDHLNCCNIFLLIILLILSVICK